MTVVLALLRGIRRLTAALGRATGRPPAGGSLPPPSGGSLPPPYPSVTPTEEARRIARTFRGLSLRAKQAAALVAAEDVVDRLGVEIPYWTDLVEHLWRGVEAWGDSFDPWFEHENPLLDAWGDQTELPTEVVEALRPTALAPPDFFRLVESLAGLFYDHLFVAINMSWVQESLEQVADVALAAGCEFPPVSRFDTTAANGDDWGRPTPDEVRQWRSGGC
jgi:hypothetical protein